MPETIQKFPPQPGVSHRGVVLVIPLLFTMSCATPVPKAGDYQHIQVPHTHMGLPVDLDLLATAKLPEDKKRVGEELLKFFHNTETSLTEYIEALEEHLEANELLSKKYGIADSIVGGVAGFSSPAVIFATAAIAFPIAGAIWVAVGLTIQKNDLEPEIEKAKERLDQARALAQLYPDIERAFDAVVFVDSEAEAERRFRKWEAFIETLRTKVSHFFAKSVHEGR